VAQVTKQGFVFLFNRVTGQSLFPIEEREVASSEVPGEVAALTQPFPTLPAPFARQELTEDMLTTRTPAAHEFAVDQFRTFISIPGPFVPLALDKTTVVFPGFDGGAEWGGAAVDPRTGVLYVNSNDVAWTGSLVKLESAEGSASEVYLSHCATCHGADRKGSPPAFPSLIEASTRLSAPEMEDTIWSGKGRMPGFPGMPDGTRHRLVNLLRTGIDSFPVNEGIDGSSRTQDERGASAPSATEQPSYVFTGYKKFLDPDGYPAIAPPWGTLSAIDLNTGHYLWHIPLGEYPELHEKCLRKLELKTTVVQSLLPAESCSSARRSTIRSFAPLTVPPANSCGALRFPTPATYMVAGRQYVVIATSNERNPKAPQGSAYVAFALPTIKRE
jgi:quinoprotein glucose dehydrogenase